MQLRTILLCVMLACIFSDTGYAARDNAKVCEQIDRKIEKIHSRMRQGYTAKQGVRLEERLRELKRKRYELCR